MLQLYIDKSNDTEFDPTYLAFLYSGIQLVRNKIFLFQEFFCRLQHLLCSFFLFLFAAIFFFPLQIYQTIFRVADSSNVFLNATK